MAAGPAGGTPAAEQQAEVKRPRYDEAELKKKQPEFEAEAKKCDADVTAALTSFATSKSLQNVKTPADLKENEAAFRDQYKSLFDAKAVANATLGGTVGKLADLDVEIKSHSVAQRGLYRKHCGHCHGTSGDGAGPAPAFLVRTRAIIARACSSSNRRTSCSTDLYSGLTTDSRRGINDTAMPSFASLLAPDELDAIIEYVKYLAICGEAESAMKIACSATARK